MTHDDGTEQGEIAKKKPKFEWLDESAFVAVSSACFAAFMFGFAVFGCIWQWKSADSAKVRGADAVVLSEKAHKPNDAENGNNRKEENHREEIRGEWELVIAYKNPARCDDDSVGSNRRIPQNVRTGEFPVFMSPLLFGASGKNFRGGAAFVIWFTAHNDRPIPASRHAQAAPSSSP
jgi:hypothetical protein